MDEPEQRKNENSINYYIRCQIREARKKAGLSQEIIAHQLGKSFVAYNRLENGRIEISIIDLLAIAAQLEIPVADLLPTDSRARAKPGARVELTPAEKQMLEAYRAIQRMYVQNQPGHLTAIPAQASKKGKKRKIK
jgi:transcriptional regulator with XRE-family HTH domain